MPDKIEKFNFDTLFVRVIDNPKVWETEFMTIPFCEVFNGFIIPNKLTATEVGMMNGDGDAKILSRDAFKVTLQKLLQIGVIEDLAIQPKSDKPTDEVVEFIKRYTKPPESNNTYVSHCKD